MHLGTAFVFWTLLFWMELPEETEPYAVTASVKVTLSSLSGRSSFTSPSVLQGLPGIRGEQGVPGPAGVQVRGTLKKIFDMTRVECPQGLYHYK